MRAKPKDSGFIDKGLLAALLLFVAPSFALAQQGEGLSHWKMIEFRALSSIELESVLAAGIEPSPLPGGTCRALVTGRQETLLAEMGLGYRTVDPDPGATAAARNTHQLSLAAAGGEEVFARGSMGGYFSPREIVDFVDSLRSAGGGLVSDTFHIGYTHEGRALWGVRMSGANGEEGMPEVFFNSLIHPREGAGLMSLLYFMQYLVENYGRADSVTSLLDNRSLLFMPLMNPDGYDVNWSKWVGQGTYYYWRKNKRDNNGNGLFDSYGDGVDLNRNFPWMWGYDNQGSSGNTTRDDYRGPSAASEPETVALREFMESRPLSAAVNLHSYGAVLINPYGYADILTADSLLYKRLGAWMTGENGYGYGNVARTLGSSYRVNGELTDWQYAGREAGGIMAWSLEVGTAQDGFWPSPGKVEELACENLALLYRTSALAGFWPEMEYLGQYTPAGDSCRVVVGYALRNIGLRAPRGELTIRAAVGSGGAMLADDSLRLLPSIPASVAGGRTVDSLIVDFCEGAENAELTLVVLDNGSRVRSFSLSIMSPGAVSYDLDRDGRVGIHDLLAMLRALSGRYPAGSLPADFDLDRSGRVDIFDLLALLRKL